MLSIITVFSTCLLGFSASQNVAGRNFVFDQTPKSFFKLEDQHSFLQDRVLQNPYNIEELRDLMSVSCHVQARDIDRDVFTVTCPSGCNENPELLWGSQTYSEDSYICAAAIHAGMIDATKGGQFSGRKIKSIQNYAGSFSNGVASKSKNDSSERGIIFQRSVQARIPTYNVCCYVKGEDIETDEFNVFCPSGCDALTENLYGSQEYADNSYLCAAAIHDSKIKNSAGGLIKVTKKRGLNSYRSEERNRIISKKLGPWPVSFTLDEIVDKTSKHLEVSCLFRGYHVAEEIFTVKCPPGCDSISDQVWGTGVYTVDSYVCAAAIHSGKIFAGSGGEVTLHRVKGSVSFIGSGQNGIITKSQTADVSHGFYFIESLTKTATTLKMSCKTQGDFILNDVATVMCPSGCDMVTGKLWGTRVFTEDSFICAAAIHDGRITAEHGGVVTVRKMPGQDEYFSSFANNLRSRGYEKWSGSFRFDDILQEVDSLIKATCDLTADHIEGERYTIICPADCATSGGAVFGDGVYTADSRLCQAAIHDGRINSVHGGKVTVNVINGKTSFSASKRNGIQSSSSPEWEKFIAFHYAHDQQQKVFSVTCNTLSEFIMDHVYTAICPPGCTETDQLYGSNIYADDSYICAAAIHDGRLNANTGGQVIVRKTPALNSYAGMTINELKSKNKATARRSFQFQDSLCHHESTFTVSCALEGIIIQEKNYAIICPPGCDKISGRVWGYKTYTDDSYICAAAIQAGKIDSSGGKVMVKRTEESTFGATDENGVESKAFQYQHKSAAFNFM